MKTGRYALKDLLLHNEVDQFIIPELQRDYVWSTIEIDKIWESILKKYNEKLSFKSSVTILENDKELNNDLIKNHLQKQLDIVKYKQKFGFLYAYHDKELPGKFFLIDGQQRLTTFYILLIALYEKLALQDEFVRNYFVNNVPKLDYKVRESAHVFLQLFLKSFHAKKDFKEDANFFESEYNYDLTVKNIIANYTHFKTKLNTISTIDWKDFLDFIENYVEFNYFDTNLSAQGEKLYLYMNSRGFKLSSQEILRSKLIEKCEGDLKIEAGEKWEDWQNFFFKNRFDNADSDFGFESFLHHVAYIKKHIKGELTKELFDDFTNLKSFQTEEFNIDFLQLSKDTLERLLFENQENESYITDYFIKGGIDVKLSKKMIFRYLSVWYYLIKFENKVTEHELDVFRMFALNQSHTRKVEDTPIETLLVFFEFVDKLHTANILDEQNILLVTQYFDNKDEELQHETHKLKWLKDENKNEQLKVFLKELYFDEMFNELVEGETGCFFYWAEEIKENLFDFDFMRKCVSIVKQLAFKKDSNGRISKDFESKYLRRFVLSHFDYSDTKGTIKSFDKFNLINDERALFSRIFQKSEFIDILKELEHHFEINLQTLDYDQLVLKQDINNWQYYIIKYPELIEHSKNNFFTKGNSLAQYIVVRNTQHSTNNHYFMNVITQHFLNRSTEKYIFNLYDLDTIYLDFVIENNKVEVTYDREDRYAIDFKFDIERNEWYYILFVRSSGEKIIDGIRYFFSYEVKESLEQNAIVLHNDILSIVNNLPNELILNARYLYK
ncbi:DUF262 domain-containing protein [Paenimyroides tangerinum]|uniref:DUF262 domain-containing protein n=1 Tax=Paenimyroides tangerinum TaxID=2488728 RepID=A0A3P3VX53_9FLAO|nr:DUF262 domain-containing protein [Paenimyroides tangerinum]RRJ86927.1 DUF262 domain-containing protein [Paenimyroides tangerinum]